MGYVTDGRDGRLRLAKDTEETGGLFAWFMAVWEKYGLSERHLIYVLTSVVTVLILVGEVVTFRWSGTEEGRIRALELNLYLAVPAGIFTLLIFFLYYRLRMRERMEAIELRNAIMKREKAEAERLRTEAERDRERYKFQILKNQLDPHFLFNSLTSLTALIHEDAGQAERFIRELAKVYRYLLRTADQSTADLRDEMAFVRSYLYLESIRTDGRLQVTEQVDERYGERQVIPCSVQMLCENALKHNTNTEESPLHITITADPECIAVSNNIQLRQPRADGEAANGIGLENLRLQYAMLEEQIECRDDGHTFTVRLPYV